MSDRPRWAQLDAESLSAITNLYPGWELECTQLTAGKTSSFCRMFEFGGLRIRQCTETIGSLNEAISPDTSTILSFPLGDQASLIWNSREVCPDKVLVLSSNYQGAVFLNDNYNVLEVEFDHKALPQLTPVAERLENIRPDDPRRVHTLSPGLSRLRDYLVDIIRSPAVLDWICSSRQCSEALVHSVAETLLHEFAVGTDVDLEDSQDNKLTRDYAVFATSSRLISATENELVQTRDLARWSNVSERQVRNAFKRLTGHTPQRYALLKRLNEAHRRLLFANQADTSVSRIATDIGFGELGRFSQYYRQLFLTKPSDTLRLDYSQAMRLHSSAGHLSPEQS